eukprot:TRINITY_DN1005_c0_g2_i2.p1 TRINITY_DN1005_c0_g2~~TRINITY_DN1005_c0_g2_i2.p1  ORF type:complete len:127 (+),score=15.61 TRINITY_DN1005_c0_g2_i2:31-381(+)
MGCGTSKAADTKSSPDKSRQETQGQGAGAEPATDPVQDDPTLRELLTLEYGKYVCPVLSQIPWSIDQRRCPITAAYAIVDISGFTKLGEALSGLGKDGVEQLRAVISSYFNKLIGT